MHRHGYKGRKFGRERDQRSALIKGLADSLVIHESIETTLPKAKELISYAEKLITKAKRGSLHDRRQIISKLSTLEASHKLVDEIAPKLTGRTSGHLKIQKTTIRRGDAAQLARISFVDDLSKLKASKPPVASPKTSAKAVAPTKKPITKAKSSKPSAKKESK